MRLALIPPDSLWEMMKLTDLHLLLPEQLERLPHDFIHSLKGYKILDNGAAELPQAVSINKLIQYVEVHRIDELVLPDTVMDCEATLGAARTYGNLKAKYPYLKLMGVAQGDTLAKMMKCITGLTYMEHVDVIGLPRWMLSMFGSESRVALARSLHEDPIYNKPIHALGANPIWPAEMRELAKVPNVRSQDTSLPFVYGLVRTWLPTSKEIWRSPGYFEAEIISEYQRKVVGDNVRLCIRWAQAPAGSM